MTTSTKLLWRFDPDALQPGDVVLEAGSTAKGRAIRTFAGGQYSHALLWLGDGSFIEAVGVGARIISFRRVIVENPDDWVVLRIPDDDAAGRAAAQQARNLAHLRYDLRGALGTQIPLLRRDDRTRLFCSQLVAEAYQRAGLTLVEGQQPNAITPRMLHTGSKLAVIESGFEELGAYDVPVTDRDDAYADSSAHVDLVISQEAVTAASKYLPQGYAAPGNLIQLYELLGSLTPEEGKAASDALIEVFDRTGYLRLIEDHVPSVRRWLEGEIAALSALSPSDRKLIAAEFARLATYYASEARRHEGLSDRYSNAHSNTGLAVWKSLAECHARRSKLFDELNKLAVTGRDKANI